MIVDVECIIYIFGLIREVFVVIDNVKLLEESLWNSAEELRGNLAPADYKHTVLGLIFLKYVSDSFQEKYDELIKLEEDAEDRDHYEAENVFWVPEKARWGNIKRNAKQPKIGVVIDDAMDIIEKENPTLKGCLPKNYAREGLDKDALGALIDLFSFKIGGKQNNEHDVLGHVYEYFLGNFGLAEGNTGQFYTPTCIVRLLVNMIEPYRGRVYDPCCGSGGMFVQSARFIEEHAGKKDSISIYGQEFTETTWKLCKMNLAIRGIDGNLGERDADTFKNDAHKNLKADFILANPPFNQKRYALKTDDVRWKFGVPPEGNANYAWIQHIISKLAPKGSAAFVMNNGSLSSDGQQKEIRKVILENGLVDCIIALPTRIFYNTPSPACVWIISKNKVNRKDKVLFIDPRKLATQSEKNKKYVEFTDRAIISISDTYHNWKKSENYKDIQGYCREVYFEEIKDNDYTITPARYVGTEEQDGVDEHLFEERMEELSCNLLNMFSVSAELESKIKAILKGIVDGE